MGKASFQFEHVPANQKHGHEATDTERTIDESPPPGNAAGQAKRCLEIIAETLLTAGVSLADVVRTRVMLTRIEDWEAVGQVHGSVFGEIRPACTFVQVSRLIDPEWLVEIEADAVIPNHI